MKIRFIAVFIFGLSIIPVLSWLQTDFPVIDQHPVGYSEGEEVHVHSDFVVYVDGMEYDFTDDKFQTSALQTVHQHAHLHDNADEVLHRHAEGVLFYEFLASLNFVITDECITTDTGLTFCTDDQNILALYVNGVAVSNPETYINQERDQILLYFGKPDSDYIQSKIDLITDESCIYSGTCPERGVAPDESCGLTCEL